jgi:hypothetical protein
MVMLYGFVCDMRLTNVFGDFCPGQEILPECGQILKAMYTEDYFEEATLMYWHANVAQDEVTGSV